MARIWLIRHARPSGQWGGGDSDPGLDEIGLIQAQEAASYLAALREPEGPPTAVVTSPLLRAIETAAPLAERLGCTVQIESGVGEIPTPVSLAGPGRGPWLRGALAGNWREIQGDVDYELWRQSVGRAVAARPGAAIFSHFVAINAVLSLIDGTSRVAPYRPDHASITTLCVENGQLRLVRLGAQAATGVA